MFKCVGYCKPVMEKMQMKPLVFPVCSPFPIHPELLLSNPSPEAQLGSYLIFPQTSDENGDADEDEDFENDDDTDDNSGSGYYLLITYCVHHLLTS